MTKSIAAAHQQLKSSPRCTTKESCADKIKLILIGSNACINLWIIMFNSSASLLAGVVGKYCINTDCCLFFFQLRGVRITSATTANISLTSKGWSCLIEVAVHFAVSAKCISDTLLCTHTAADGVAGEGAYAVLAALTGGNVSSGMGRSRIRHLLSSGLCC